MLSGYDREVNRTLDQMREDWDIRARSNARHYVATGKSEWSDAEFFESGREAIRNFILSDMGNICQGKEPKTMRVIEIGCGAGRVTLALAEMFGEVQAVDVSGEMVTQARAATAHLENVHVYHNNGMDLAPLTGQAFDFAFSCIVFQHIPSREVIDNYVIEVGKRLSPGSLFKFQMQGATVDPAETDTWIGIGYSEDQARALAERAGFEMRYSRGAGEQDFWLWFFKR